MMYAAIMGYGTIGSGVAEILESRLQRARVRKSGSSMCWICGNFLTAQWRTALFMTLR